VNISEYCRLIFPTRTSISVY